MKKKQLIIISLTSLIFIVFLFLSYSRNVNNILNNLFKLKKDYTITQANKDGLTDVSKIENTKNVKIEKFLSKVSSDEWAILKTVKLINNQIIINLYINDNKMNLIRAWTYNVTTQSLDNPNRCFNQKYEIKNNNGLTETWLINIYNPENPNNQDTTLKDEVLYIYDIK